MPSNHRNQILGRLRPEERASLERHLEPVTLNFKERLHYRSQPIKDVYFVNSGVVSLVTNLEEGGIIETGTVGREGMVGVSVFLGQSLPPTDAIVQVAGDGLKLPVRVLNETVQNGGQLNVLLLRYANVVLATSSQTAACNRAHSLEERMARWLLMTRDRVGADEFLLTQEFLSQMLGVRRPSVSLAGATLQKAGLIRYSRGRIVVLNGPALEDVSCECYGIIRNEFEGQLRAKPPRMPGLKATAARDRVKRRGGGRKR